MKLIHCHIRRFGFLNDRNLDFQEGIHLIYGPNESGKSTLHTAIAALLFGMGRGRGRAAKNDLYHQYLPWGDSSEYGGALDWSLGKECIHAERDFSANPPTAYITAHSPEGERELSSDSAPLPAALTPYLFFNTLSFRQIGGAADENLSGELQEHIRRLQSTGNESIDLARAEQLLKARRKQLEKELDPAAPEEYRRLSAQLAQLEAESPGDSSRELSAVREKRREREQLLQQLNDDRSALQAQIQEAEKALASYDPDRLAADGETAEELDRYMTVYEENYTGRRVPSPRSLSSLSLLCGAGLAGCFIPLSRLIQAGRPGAACLCLIPVCFLTCLLYRLSRMQDALTAHTHNRQLAAALMQRYRPKEPACGSHRELQQLRDYLKEILRRLEQLEQQRTGLRQLTEQIIDLGSHRDDFEQELEAMLRRKLRREDWEITVRELQDRQEELIPRLRSNEQIQEDLDALDLALRRIRELAGTSRMDFAPALTRYASEIFREITGGNYDGLRVHGDLGLEAVMGLHAIPVSVLSGGTAEQVWFSLRMALIRLLWPDEPMPLFLDESFARYDQARLTNILRFLHRHYRGQVFLFSCQKREEDLLLQEQIPFTKIEL